METTLKGRPKKFSDQTEKEIVSHYIDDNWTAKKINETYGCNKILLYNICIRQGKKTLIPFGNTHIIKIKTACNFSYKQIIEYAIDNDMTFEDLTESLELNEQEIKTFKNYVMLRGYCKFVPTRKGKTVKINRIIRKMLENGTPVEEIVMSTGMSLKKLKIMAAAWKHYGLLSENMLRKKNYGMTQEDMDKLIKFTENGDKSYIDICNEFMWNYSTAITYVKKTKLAGHDIKIRHLKYVPERP